VNISKNASSYMADILSRQGWTVARWGHDNRDYSLVKEMIVILRDPVDRWTSGVAQYLITRILNSIGSNSYIDDDAVDDVETYPLSASAFIIAYNALIERFIFDNLDLLDDHVWLQSAFFEHIMPDVPRRYVVISDDFAHHLDLLGIETFPDGDRNFSGDDPDKSMLKYFFQERLDRKPSLMKKVKMTYSRDYEIIRNALPIC